MGTTVTLRLVKGVPYRLKDGSPGRSERMWGWRHVDTAGTVIDRDDGYGSRRSAEQAGRHAARFHNRTILGEP